MKAISEYSGLIQCPYRNLTDHGHRQVSILHGACERGVDCISACPFAFTKAEEPLIRSRWGVSSDHDEIWDGLEEAVDKIHIAIDCSTLTDARKLELAEIQDRLYQIRQEATKKRPAKLVIGKPGGPFTLGDI